MSSSFLKGTELERSNVVNVWNAVGIRITTRKKSAIQLFGFMAFDHE